MLEMGYKIRRGPPGKRVLVDGLEKENFFIGKGVGLRDWIGRSENFHGLGRF